MSISGFGSLKTSATSMIVSVALALCLANTAWAAGRGGFGGCDGWGGIYCESRDVSYAPELVYEAIFVGGPAVVYIPRYYFPRRCALWRHFAPRRVACRYCVCR